jgi:potassium efflux system protein
LLLLYQPFKIGDLIEVNNISGKVAKMSLRYTHLVQQDKEILIPNASLLIHPIIIVNNKEQP